MKTQTIEKTSAYDWLHEYQTEKMIAELKEKFSAELKAKLNLIKVEAPLVVEQGSGINDDLNGIEKPVAIQVPCMAEKKLEIVHSLAKWKRYKLARMKTKPGEGIVTDMRAIRQDEMLSDIHSIYVDQWDWEKVILPENRSISYLKKVVEDVYAALKATEKLLVTKHEFLRPVLAEEITFIHAQDLQKQFPNLSPKERENEICRQKGAVFIIGIGAKLADGNKHDGRAPDYDDWSTETKPGYPGLNGDILVWNPVLKRAFEISSMGIRVDKTALRKQLGLEGEEKRLQLKWHTMLLNDELPLTIGGGIGQSRLAMLLLGKKHIGEVQASIWPEEISINQNLQLL